MDLRTLALINIVVHLLQVAAFTLQFRVSRPYKGIGWWLLWSISIALGFVFMLIREMPELQNISIILQNTLFIAGVLFLFLGIAKFLGKKVNYYIIFGIILIYAVFLSVYTFIYPDIIIRSVVFNIVLCLIAYYTSYYLIKFRLRYIQTTFIFLSIVFALHGTVFAYRSFSFIMGISIVVDVYESSFVNILPILDALVASCLFTYGLIIMVNQRLYQEMREAKEHFEVVFNTSPDPSLITRAKDGLVIDLNQAFIDLSGYSREYSVGKSSIEINIWKNLNDRDKVLEILKKEGTISNFQSEFTLKSGKTITGLMSAGIINLNGVPHILSVTRDISGRIASEEEIKRKNEQLEILNSERDKFYSIIAHDLRSPFNNFLGYSEMLVTNIKTMTTDEIFRIGNNMNMSANNLYRLLTNLLNWTLVNRNLMEFKPERILFTDLVNDILVLLNDVVKAKYVKISKRVTANLYFTADKNMMETLLRNLIMNAIKFCNKGGSVLVTAEYKDEKTFQITIKDDGIGMDKEILENLFKVNSDTKRKGTDNEYGTGLGLLLCKEFAEIHKGRIYAESKEGKGSTFIVELPSEQQK